MPVPETTVNEQHLAKPAEYKIRLPGQGSLMQSVTKSQLKRRFPNSQFRLCVLAPDERHTLTAFSFTEAIHAIPQILIGITT